MSARRQLRVWVPRVRGHRAGEHVGSVPRVRVVPPDAGATVNPERHQRVSELYHEALARPGEDERRAFLQDACRGDPDLQREVEELLAAHERATAFMATPAIEIAATSFLTDEISLPRACGHYTIESLLGRGGMGEVYLARDTTLGRRVALKVLRHSHTADARSNQRFEQEARAASSLNHPNIVTIHEIGDMDGGRFIAMELVEGQSLSALIGQPCAVGRLAHIGHQLAQALSVAHAAGIVHRDIKPENVMVRADGYVKVLDFGVSRLLSDAVGSRGPSMTNPGLAVGTPRYMSPEQARGEPATASSDIFALGVVLYELATGRHPFEAESILSTLQAIATRVPVVPSELVSTIPASLDGLIIRMLDKVAGARPTIEEVEAELAALATGSLAVPQSTPLISGAARPVGRLSKSKRAIATGVLAALVVVAAVSVVRSYVHASRVRWVQQVAIPEIGRLIAENRRLAAKTLFQQALSYEPTSRELVLIGEAFVTMRVAFHTNPEGASVYISDYRAAAGDDAAGWQLLGKTPFETEQLPLWGFYRVRAVKGGFVPQEQSVFGLDRNRVDVNLHAEGEVPPGMTWVPQGAVTTPAPTLTLPGFWIDTYEVSNRQFKSFVDAGGYRNKKYWTHRLIADGRELGWDAAMEEFHDLAGRNGPSGWQLGTYPEGSDDLPVSGVSWYEAAAYAEFAGKSLPTVYEWFAAAGTHQGGGSDIFPMSNFNARGPSAVGSHRGMARYGSYDMAGNVKEWMMNARDESTRYMLGGAWDEAEYMFNFRDAAPPSDRKPTVGFRLVKRVASLPAAAFDPVRLGPSNTSLAATPVDDKVFKIYLDYHAYDKTALESRVERVVESPDWKRETVSFRAAYGTERVIAHLFLPTNAAPPYQIVAFFGHSGILDITRIEDLRLPYEFVVRSGRALIIPAYSGTLERGRSELLPPPVLRRERALQWSKDLGRSLDYLETRADINISRLAFYGVSLGAAEGARLVAVEPRFTTAVLASGGLYRVELPEIDPNNFAPRVHVPVLMLSGRQDLIYPLETHQKPLFAALGTKEKVFSQYDGSHANLLTRPELMGEILDWLDKYLGRVERVP